MSHPRSSSPAKGITHRPEPPVVVTVNAMGVDAEQDLDRVPGPLGDQGRRHARVEPPGDAGMAEVVRPTSQWRADLRLGQNFGACTLQHPPQRRRLIKAAPAAPRPALPAPGFALGRPARHARAVPPPATL
jgi:hypothetical protein